MATTANSKDGSWFLSCSAALGGTACLIVTGLILKHFGESLGATESGRVLLGAASVLVHVIGLVIMGLAFGHFCRVKNWYWAPVALLIMLGSGGYTITSIMGFVATERISVAQARQDAAQAKIKRANDAAEAAKERQRAQERLAKSQLGFMQAEVKDAEGKSRRVLQKNFAGDAAKIIAEVGKEPSSETPSGSGEVALRPDAQSEQLSEMTGVSVSAVQLTLMAWIAIMMVALEIVLWPLASFLKPRPIAVDLIEAKPEARTPLAAGREAGTALQPVPEPKALPAPLVPELPAVRVSVPDPVPDLEPLTVAIPKPLILLPGADLWLKEMKFPLAAPRAGDLQDWPSHTHAAKCFACWLRAYGLEGPFSHGQMLDLWARCCTAYHRDPLIWNQFKGSFEKVRGVEWRKMRIDGQETPRPMRWFISSSAADIRKFAKEPANDKEADSPKRSPLAAAVSTSSMEAANENSQQVVRRKVSPPAWLDLQSMEARQMKAMQQQKWAWARKQRGSRVTRRAA